MKWNTREEAEAFRPELERWKREQQRVLGRVNCFVVSGTWSDPAYNPSDIPLVNAMVPQTLPHVFGAWDYAKCAGTCGFWYAFFRRDWDVLIYTDTTVLLNCDLTKHIEAFYNTGKYIMCCTGAFGLWLENGFAAYTRPGVVHYLHSRLVPDLHPTRTMLSEEEMTTIFKGHVYNPWPDVPDVRCDFEYLRVPLTAAQEDHALRVWPAITKPSPRLVELHRAKYGLPPNSP